MSKNNNLTIAIMEAGLILCLAARIFTIITATDMETGFLYHGSEILHNLLFYGICGAVMVGCAITARGSVGYEFRDGKAVVIGAAMLIMSACACYEGISEFSAYSPSVFLTAADLAGAALMLALALATLSAKKFGPALCFCYTLTGVYFVVRGIYTFINRMAITTVPEYFLDTLSVIFGAFFFAVLGKTLSGNTGKSERAAFCFWGAGTAVLSLSSSLGVIISKLAAPAEISSRITASSYEAEFFNQEIALGNNGYMMSFMPIVNTALGVFAAAAVITALAPEKRKNS